jgi:hypothetical protein
MYSERSLCDSYEKMFDAVEAHSVLDDGYLASLESNAAERKGRAERRSAQARRGILRDNPCAAPERRPLSVLSTCVTKQTGDTVYRYGRSGSSMKDETQDDAFMPWNESHAGDACRVRLDHHCDRTKGFTGPENLPLLRGFVMGGEGSEEPPKYRCLNPSRDPFVLAAAKTRLTTRYRWSLHSNSPRMALEAGGPVGQR